MDQLQVQHVASHRDPATEDDPVDEWTAIWNGRADALASLAHTHRPEEVDQLHSNLVVDFLVSEAQVDRFRDLHLALAECAADHSFQDDEAEDEEVASEPLPSVRPLMPGGDWIDALPLGWVRSWQHSSFSEMYEPAVVLQLVQWLQHHNDLATQSYAVSWLELVAMLEATQFCYPLLVSQGGVSKWISADNVAAASQGSLTVAAKMRFVRELITKISRFFDLGVVAVGGLDLSQFNIHPPQMGISLSVSAHVLRMAGSELLRLTSSRSIRVCTDFARPF